MAKGKMGFEGGKYSAKSGNLSKAQLKRAGATKAAAKQPVDIGTTSRATEGVNKGRTLGPGGKPLTGSVKLLNGQMAVYKAGKRVINVKSSKGSNSTPPPPPPPKTGSYQAGKGTTSTAGTRARSAAQAKIFANRNKTDSYQAGKGTTPKAGARARSAAQAKIFADRNRPSFAKQQAAVAQALIDFRNATTEATKASAKRKYDQHVSVLNGIKDYFR